MSSLKQICLLAWVVLSHSHVFAETSQQDRLDRFEEFIEASAFYVGSCHALEHLKQKYCPKISIPDAAMCRGIALGMTPADLIQYLPQEMFGFKAETKKKIAADIDLGFTRMLALAGGDQEKTCLIAGSQWLTVNDAKLKETRRIARWLK